MALIVDEKLSWGEHIEHVIHKVKSVMGVLYRMQKVLNQTTLKAIDYSYIHSHLHDVLPECKLKEPDIIQNKSLRLIYTLP